MTVRWPVIAVNPFTEAAENLQANITVLQAEASGHVKKTGDTMTGRLKVPSIDGNRVRGAALTDKTSFGAIDTMENWGSSLNVGQPTIFVFITAQVAGSILTASGVSRAGQIRIRISLDGGSTWSDGTSNWCAATSTLRREGVAASHFTSGTPTGDIRVQVQALISGGLVTDIDFVTGTVTVQVAPDA